MRQAAYSLKMIGVYSRAIPSKLNRSLRLANAV